jgi:glycerol-3-phosphate dehydrogenase (NAD(P)+)
MSRIAIIGAGSWGTALAIVLGRSERHSIRLWVHEREVCDAISRHHTNDIFLPHERIPECVVPTTSLAGSLSGAEIVLGVMPSHHCRSVFQQMSAELRPEMLFVSATKGIENDSLLRISQIISEVVARGAGFEPRIGALSGPSFAKEVAKGDPTAITIASPDSELCAVVQREFSDAHFRVYQNDDIVGVELGGALKNVIAIAAGICDGMGLGHNSVAALITRGLAEITRLAVASGAKPATLAGLSGIGDLVLTCTGGLSRNRSVGVELGKGRKLPDIVAGMHGMVAEGVLTTNAAVGLARKMDVEMPIAEQMYSILHDGKPVRDAVSELMSRPGKSE